MCFSHRLSPRFSTSQYDFTSALAHSSNRIWPQTAGTFALALYTTLSYHQLLRDKLYEGSMKELSCNFQIYPEILSLSIHTGVLVFLIFLISSLKSISMSKRFIFSTHAHYVGRMSWIVHYILYETLFEIQPPTYASSLFGYMHCLFLDYIIISFPIYWAKKKKKKYIKFHTTFQRI